MDNFYFKKNDIFLTRRTKSFFAHVELKVLKGKNKDFGFDFW